MLVRLLLLQPLSVVGSTLDYCNSVIYGALNSTTAKLQRVQNCLAPSLVLYSNGDSHVMFSLYWNRYMASDFPSNQLQAGNIGVQNTVNIPTDISSTTHPPPVYRSSMSLRSSGATDSNCIRQPRFQRGCIGLPNIWNKLPADVLAANSPHACVSQEETEDTSIHVAIYSRNCNVQPAPLFLSLAQFLWRSRNVFLTINL